MSSWHFPNGKAAGPSQSSWNEGKTFPGLLSHPPKSKKAMVPLPTSVQEEGTDEVEVHNPDMEMPSTSREQYKGSSVLVLKIENYMLRKENDELKKELEKQKQTFSFTQVQYFTGLPDAATVLFLEALLYKFG